MKRKKTGFGTTAVHSGNGEGFIHHPSSTPIYQTSTFFFKNVRHAQEVYRQKREGFLYTRIGNPTVRAFEQKVAALEQAEDAVAFASGMAAISAVFLEILRPGDEVLSSGRIYGGSRSFFDQTLKNVGCSVRYFEPDADISRTVTGIVTPKTRIIFFETPSNPELSILDIGQIASLAKKRNIVSVIDNTFATPYLQRPAEYGIDCLIHSATKYFGGHGDAIGGVVAGTRDLIAGIRRNILMNVGGCLSPFNAWLLIRGLQTLHVRMDRHCRTAKEIASFLLKQRKVTHVFYPGLREHPGHRVARKQMRDFGGMVSFRLPDRRACARFLNRLRLCRLGVSLGDVETLALSYAAMFHPNRSDTACRKMGIDPLLVRISTGLEDADDIISDIRDALKAV